MEPRWIVGPRYFILTDQRGETGQSQPGRGDLQCATPPPPRPSRTLPLTEKHVLSRASTAVCTRGASRGGGGEVMEPPECLKSSLVHPSAPPGPRS